MNSPAIVYRYQYARGVANARCQWLALKFIQLQAIERYLAEIYQKPSQKLPTASKAQQQQYYSSWTVTRLLLLYSSAAVG